MLKKENIPLAVGLALPVLLVLVLAAVIYVPRLYVKPQYDFVYAVGDYPQYFNDIDKTVTTYRIVDEQVRKEVVPYAQLGDQNWPRLNVGPQFYRYDVTEEKSVPLNESELMQIRLNPSQKSPDGFELNYGRGDENVFEAVFGGRDYSERVLEKGSVGVAVNIEGDNNNYDYRFHLIGWTI